jgi:myo-inositol 2-dehydrogenase/D-chiro-inositol 1-dehydrogenase
MKTFALFGAGRIGRIHAANIHAHARARLKYVVDVSADAAAEIATSTGASHVDTATALSDREVDALLIASPTDTHADLIESGAAAGKAMLCEKPVDLDAARGGLVAGTATGAANPQAFGNATFGLFHLTGPRIEVGLGHGTHSAPPSRRSLPLPFRPLVPVGGT